LPYRHAGGSHVRVVNASADDIRRAVLEKKKVIRASEGVVQDDGRIIAPELRRVERLDTRCADRTNPRLIPAELQFGARIQVDGVSKVRRRYAGATHQR